MSKQEIREEYKQTEGDPLIRSKIRQRQRQIASQRMMQAVPTADVIVTNPTHLRRRDSVSYPVRWVHPKW